MSLENYSALIQFSVEDANGWERRRTLTLLDIQIVQAIRSNFRNVNRLTEINTKLNKSENLKTILAAELFPDELPPLLFMARKVSSLHDDVRTSIEITYHNLARKPRISGEVIVTKDDIKFFLCDPIMLSSNKTSLPTNKNYMEVANILIELGYIPVDAEFNLLPKTP